MNHHPGKVLRKLGVSMLALIIVPITLFAQQVTITPNYKEADIRQIVEAVSAVTNRNFIIDPRVNAKVTMLSKTPMTPDAFYEAFLAILEVHQLAAHPGNPGRKCRRRTARTDPAAPDPAVRTPGSTPGIEHAYHLGPCRQCLTNGQHHPPYRPVE
jgi:hypothetical protein